MIGVVGLGVVGKAMVKLLDHNTERRIATYDINGTGNCADLKELSAKSRITFVCVPTPAVGNGLDISTVVRVCSELYVFNYQQIIVVRSTVPIGTCRKLRGRIVYNPEFCNALTAFEDMVTTDRIVLGGNPAEVELAKELYDSIAYDCGRIMGNAWATVRMVWEDAEALKLVTNAAMATKITFANEAAFLCKKLGADWAAVSRILALDKRLGSVGWQVPGPDGLYGFGGACLPKDLAGYIAQANSVGSPIAVGEAVKRSNDHIRKTVAAWVELIDNLLAAEGKS